jgi:Acyl-protein synthetase, LuxE
VSALLDHPPFGPRDEAAFLAEMHALNQHHRAGCPAFARVWPDDTPPASAADLPFLHVGLFKRLDLRTSAPGIRHTRQLNSSATTSGVSSKVALDERSSLAQGRSTLALFTDFIGAFDGPLLVLDSAKSLTRRDGVTARLAAALSLRPLARELTFLLPDADRPEAVDWSRVEDALARFPSVMVYGFTWILWQAWARSPQAAALARADRRLVFVHSGGWKKLEAARVERAEFDRTLLAGWSPDSRVVDFYGLVEQPGLVYPLCSAGFRHAPGWASALVRDPATLAPLTGVPGQLQLLNSLALGAPVHSVLTEDLAVMPAGDCPCGRHGPRFELLGRLPRAEMRGCANV